MSCSFCVIFLNVSVRKTRVLIFNAHTLVRFLPSFCGDEQLKRDKSINDDKISVFGNTSSITMPMESSIHVIAEYVEMEQNMRSLHETRN